MAVAVAIDVYIVTAPNTRDKYQQGSKQLKQSLENSR